RRAGVPDVVARTTGTVNDAPLTATDLRLLVPSVGGSPSSYGAGSQQEALAVRSSSQPHPPDIRLLELSKPNTGGLGSKYTATVRWGDGTQSRESVLGSGGTLWVTGNHAYQQPGNYLAEVTLQEGNELPQVFTVKVTATPWTEGSSRS